MASCLDLVVLPCPPLRYMYLGGAGTFVPPRVSPKYGYSCLAISVASAADGTYSTMWNDSLHTGRAQFLPPLTEPPATT